MNVARCVVEYDGTDYCGFQYQPQLRTVAGVLEEALATVLHDAVKVTAAGRTDAGVHATGQVISFAIRPDFPIERLAIALNTVLPEDIRVLSADFAGGGFSARFSALERTYVYLVLNRREPSALLRRSTCHVHRDLDLDRMRSAAQELVGERDFSSFCGVLPDHGPTVRTLRSLEIGRAGEFVRFRLTADGFLHRMARNCIGTLLEIGSGRRPPDSIPAILAARDRRAAGMTAPAQGLYLAGVRYEDFDSLREPQVIAPA